MAVRLAAALGTALKRGDRVVAAATRPPRLPDDQAGDDRRPQLDRRRRRRPARAARRRSNRHLLKTESFDAGFHVGVSYTDPEVVQIRFFEQPGHPADRRGCRRRSRSTSRATSCVGRRTTRSAASLPGPGARDLRAGPARHARPSTAIRQRSFRIVVDYGYSAASYVLPLVLGPLGVEAISAHALRRRLGRGDGSSTLRGVDRPGEAARRRRSGPISAPSSTGLQSACS